MKFKKEESINQNLVDRTIIDMEKKMEEVEKQKEHK